MQINISKNLLRLQYHILISYYYPPAFGHLRHRAWNVVWVLCSWFLLVCSLCLVLCSLCFCPKNSTKICKKNNKNHEKTVLGAPWGPSGAPRGGPWEPSGPQGRKRQRKVSYFPPAWGPKLEPKMHPRALQELKKQFFF